MRISLTTCIMILNLFWVGFQFTTFAIHNNLFTLLGFLLHFTGPKFKLQFNECKKRKKITIIISSNYFLHSGTLWQMVFIFFHTKNTTLFYPRLKPQRHWRESAPSVQHFTPWHQYGYSPLCSILISYCIQRTVRRICKLTLGCKGFTKWTLTVKLSRNSCIIRVLSL